MSSYLFTKALTIYRFIKKNVRHLQGETFRFHSKFISLFTKNKTIKIKLVAIAKNEAAYLPDWVFHHLYFGFDQLNIYVNNTIDNTDKIAEQLGRIPNVSFMDGDSFFNQGAIAPQINIYKKELKQSKKQGFTHIMFLDIDEFWMPINFETSIYQLVSENKNKIICFEWLNRINENEPFMAACPAVLLGHKARSVKSIIPTGLFVSKINPHNVLAHRAQHILADGTEYKPTEDDFSRVGKCELDTPIKPYFIMHRMYRSEDEYLALLGRGRPIQNRKDIGSFKNNRNGYIPQQNEIKIAFPLTSYMRYEHRRNEFYSKYALVDIIGEAKAFVLSQRESIVELIRNAPQSEAATLKKVLKNVGQADILEAYFDFKKRYNLL